MPFIRKYGTATANGTHIVIPIVIAGEQNFATGSDWTPAAGDVKVTKDDGTPGNIASLPTYVTSQGWEFQFSLAELQCKKLDVLIVDSATKAIEDQFFSIETYGDASAMMPIDFSDATRMGLTALPNAAADGAGGLPISDAGGLDLDAMDTNVSSVLTDTGTTLPATLTTIEGKIDTVDTVADGIKAKTDDLTFTVANKLDSNVHYVNDVEVDGTGGTGDEWGPV